MLANEINQSGSEEFKKLIVEDENDEDENQSEESKADVAMEDANEAAAGQAQAQTMMIDTTQADGLAKSPTKQTQSKSDDAKLKRSASQKLALMLIGTMRIISKGFRVDLLKGLLLQEDYFAVKGSHCIQKQSEYNSKTGKQL